MHYMIGVVLPFQYEEPKLTEAIEEILKPWDERDGENENGRWDWWQLGGRWTGAWSDYDPATDPANMEMCRLCHGTGMRNDETGRAHRAENPDYTCNGCGYEQGPRPGVKLKWPTQWVRKPSTDVVPVRHLLSLDDSALPYALAAGPDVWLERETWNGEDFVPCPDWPAVCRAALEQRRDCFVAVVDIHS